MCVFEVKGHQAPGIRGSLHRVSCREDFQLRWYREREAWDGVWGQDIGWCVDVVGPRAVPDLRWALHSLTFEVAVGNGAFSDRVRERKALLRKEGLS